MTSNWETWSRGTNSRLPFDVNEMINLSIDRLYNVNTGLVT